MITHETRRESYDNILPKCGERHRLCLHTLQRYGPQTANELAMIIHEIGHTPYFSRNFVHPRLNELVGMGLVEVLDKRTCDVTGKTVAVYALKGDGASDERGNTDNSHVL